MTIIELKNSLIEQISKSDDFELLDLLRTIMQNQNSDIPELTDEQLRRLKESREQFARGEFYTNEEADKLVDKWFEGK